MELAEKKIYCKKCGNERIIGVRCKLCEKEKNRKYRIEHLQKTKELSKKWFKEHPTYRKDYREKNIERINYSINKWQKKHPEAVNRKAMRYRKLHPDRCLESVRKWQLKNPEKVKEIDRRRGVKRRKTIKWKLNMSMASGMLYSLKGCKNNQKWEKLAGYTIKQLKEHLEKQFVNGMSWENQGSYWHIDHKIPIAVFNFKTPEDIDFKRCWDINNLQPLAAIKNMSKGKKLTEPFQPSLCINA
jgi:hypothetical protein